MLVDNANYLHRHIRFCIFIFYEELGCFLGLVIYGEFDILICVCWFNVSLDYVLDGLFIRLIFRGHVILVEQLDFIFSGWMFGVGVQFVGGILDDFVHFL